MTAPDGIDRIVGQPVVVAVVSERSRALGKIAQVGFVLLVENSILRREPVGNGLGCLRKRSSGGGEQKQDSDGGSHRMISVNRTNESVNSSIRKFRLPGTALFSPGPSGTFTNFYLAWEHPVGF